MILFFFFIFFFKQKTAYEMRISDWSSDVCSSDLLPCGQGKVGIGAQRLDGLETDLDRAGLRRLQRGFRGPGCFLGGGLHLRIGVARLRSALLGNIAEAFGELGGIECTAGKERTCVV